MIYEQKGYVMEKKYTPKKKYLGDPKDFAELDETIQQAIADNDELRFEYEKESINLFIAGLTFKLRSEAGLTQKQLAKKIGVPQPFISRLENPESKKISSIDSLARVATAFNKRVMIKIV